MESGGVDGVEDGDGVREVVHAGGCQFDPACGSGEEGDAQFLLEVPDLSGQRWLRDVQTRGGAAEMQFLGNGPEVPEVTQLHTGDDSLSDIL